MHMLSAAIGMVAGICGYVGLLHLLVGWRSERRAVHITFALLCFCIAVMALATAALHQAESVTAYTNALKWQQAAVMNASALAIWFITFASGLQRLVFPVGISMVVLFALIVHVTAPFGILFDQIGGLAHTVTWWGERLPRPLAIRNGPWWLFLLMSYLAMAAYVGYACSYLYRRGEHTAALRLGLGLGSAFVARFFDRTLLFEGQMPPSLMLYAYLALIVVMSLGFLGDLMRVAQIRQQAAAAMQRLNAELEQRVAARTAELQASNMLLEQQHRQADRRRRVAESLGDLVDLLNADRPLEDLWSRVASVTNRLFEARATALYQRTDGNNTLLALAGYDTCQLENSASTFSPLLDQALPTGKPVVLAEETEPGDSVLLLVPLACTYFSGALLLAYDHPHSFNTDDQALAMALGDQVALAIDNAQLRRQVVAAAAAEERSRLARELHDSVTQTLYTITTITEALPYVAERHPHEVRPSLLQLRRLAQGALAEMRSLLLELRPTALLERPLNELLRQLADTLLGRTTTTISASLAEHQPLPNEVQIALYRIAQEALNNSIRHGQATQIWIELCSAPDLVCLSIRDNGHGFDPQSGLHNGFGLVNMHERASAIGANFSIQSEPGCGTKVRVAWRSVERATYAPHRPAMEICP